MMFLIPCLILEAVEGHGLVNISRLVSDKNESISLKFVFFSSVNIPSEIRTVNF